MYAEVAGVVAQMGFITPLPLEILTVLGLIMLAMKWRSLEGYAGAAIAIKVLYVVLVCLINFNGLPGKLCNTTYANLYTIVEIVHFVGWTAVSLVLGAALLKVRRNSQ